MLRRTALVAALLALLSAPTSLHAAEEPDARAARVALLERAVQRDEATLRRLVKLPPDAPLHDHPVLRDIARRLPAMQAELRRLRSEPQRPAGGLPPP